MYYVVLDMEWNQPMNVQQRVRKPVKLFGEIVQIGAVKLNEQFQILDTFNIMVSPKYYKKMNWRISKLTKITSRELKDGFPFPAALEHFREWCGSEFAFLIWGADDIAMLRDNILLHRLDANWIPDTFNLQMIFDEQITKEKRQISLTQAVEMLSIPALEAHDALNDAMNTARICDYLNMEKGISEYHQLMANRKKKYSKDAAVRTYRTRLDAIHDPDVFSFDCPSCGKPVVCSALARQDTNKYICIGTCEDGDEIFIRFVLRRYSDGRFSAKRIVHEINEKRRNYYHSKLRHDSVRHSV